MKVIRNILDKKWLGPAIALVFLFLAFRNFKYYEFKNAVLHLNFYYIPAMLLLLFLAYIIRAIRWKYILSHEKKISLYNSFAIIFIGQMGNSLLPIRMGEIMRAYALGNRENISKSLTFASIMLERVIDGIVLATLVAAIAFIFHLTFWVKTTIILAILLFGMSLFIFILFAYRFYKLTAFLKRSFLEGWISKLKDLSAFLSEFIRGLQILKNRKLLIIVFAISFIIWFFESLMYSMLFNAFSVKLPFYAPMFILGITNLGVVIPSLPGHFGTFHYFFILALLVFGISQTEGLIYAITFHGIGYLFVVLSGLLFTVLMGQKLIIRDISPGILLSKKRQAEFADPPSINDNKV